MKMKKMGLLLIAVLALSAITLSACTNSSNKTAGDQATSGNNTPVQVKTSAGNVTVETVTGSSTVSDKSFTLEDVKLHASKSDCWTVINNNVYDLTSYIASGKHKPVIVDGCGIDSTSMFAAVDKHAKPQAQNMLPTLIIGTLAK